MATVNIGYLIPVLRLNIGDTDQTSLRYDNEWLRVALLAATKILGRWWNFKYLVNVTTNEIYRNPNATFLFAEPPVIEAQDEDIIVIVAAISILQGALENSAWDLTSWRDAEISFSNLEGGRIRDNNINRLWNKLLSMIKPPSKRLAWILKNDLPGYKPSGNQNYEHEGEF
jgi:hypothetical protein